MGWSDAYGYLDTIRQLNCWAGHIIYLYLISNNLALGRKKDLLTLVDGALTEGLGDMAFTSAAVTGYQDSISDK